MNDTTLRPILHKPFLALAHALRSRPTGLPPPQPLQRHEAPGLFDLVNRIAGKLGVMVPYEILIVAQAGATVLAERRWNGRAARLTIQLGLPLFAWLSRRELGAVIAREIGQAGVVNATLAPQAREFAADAVAARLFGAAAMCAALRKIHLLEPMWGVYVHQDLCSALDCGVRVPVFDGFRRFCAASPKRREVYDAVDAAPARDVVPAAGRPSLEERLEAMAPDVSERLPRPATCIDLVGGEDSLEALWYARIEAGDWPATEWDTFGNAFLSARIRRRFTETLLDPQTMPLTELPDAAQALDAWAARLRPDGAQRMPANEERAYVLAILHDWIVACLCQARFSLRVRPGMDPVLERYGLAVDPAQLLAAACAGKLAVRDLVGFTHFADTAMLAR